MYGLKIKKEYLIDIINGNRITEVRKYNAPINGKVALIEAKSCRIYGYADITRTRFITYKEYVMWHVNDNFSIKSAEDYYEKTKMFNTFDVYYEYVFSNVVSADKTIKPKILKREKSWVYFD